MCIYVYVFKLNQVKLFKYVKSFLLTRLVVREKGEHTPISINVHREKNTVWTLNSI